jgi:hypothetical protein
VRRAFFARRIDLVREGEADAGAAAAAVAEDAHAEEARGSALLCGATDGGDDVLRILVGHAESEAAAAGRRDWLGVGAHGQRREREQHRDSQHQANWLNHSII